MRRALVAAVLATAALGVGGCHAAASSAPVPSGSTAADPLAGVDAQLDQIERGLDADAGASS